MSQERRQAARDFACACDIHVSHDCCTDDECPCVQQVRRDKDRTTPAGRFAVLTTYVWLDNRPERSRSKR